MESNVIAKSFHHALSILDDTSHATAIFILEDRYGMRIHGQGQSTVEGIANGSGEMLSSAAQALMINMQHYLAQTALTWSDLTVKRVA